MSRRQQPTSASSARELLQPQYFYLTTFVGLCGTGIGLAVVMMVAKPMAVALGLDPEASLQSQESGWHWLAALMVWMAIAIYLGCAIVAGAVGTFLLRRGELTSREFILYALLFRHPESWFRTSPDRHEQAR
jgi:hypothetical protein